MKNRITHYTAGWLSFLLAAGIADAEDVREAGRRASAAAIDEILRRRRKKKKRRDK